MKRHTHSILFLLPLALVMSCSDDEDGKEQPGSPQAHAAVEALSQSVDVYRDEWGIPHIYAHNRGDMVFVQGYEMARDRPALNSHQAS
jgi:penicillin amidase